MQNPTVRAFDRRLFLIVAVMFPLLVLLGFGPTYYAKTWFGTPPLPSTVVHIHGLLMSLWVVLFIAQVTLVSTRQLHTHQRIGWAGVGLAGLIVLTGIPTALRAGKYGSAASPPDIAPLSFMVVPVFDLLMFVVLFGAAIYFRKRPANHKAMMLLTVLNFLPPALGRVHIPALQVLGPLFFFGVPALAALVCLGLDARMRGRVNRVFASGALLLIASYVIRLAIMTSAPWIRFATWATSFV
jgi:hypothetical protein